MAKPLQIKRGSVVVKIYTVKHGSAAAGVVFTVSWHVGGKRMTRQFTDLTKAREEAALKADQLAAGRVDAALNLNGDDGAALVEARRLCAGTPLVSALKEWARARDLTDGNVIAAAEAWRGRNRGGIKHGTVSTVLDLFLAQKKRDGLNTAKNHGAQFDSLRAQFGTYEMGAVTESMLTNYLNRIKHPVSRNTHRKRMVTLWRWAQKKKFLSQDVKCEADQTERAKEEPFKIGITDEKTLAQLLALIRAELPADLPALVLGAFCGLRRGEIHGQRWEDINLEERHVHVTHAKAGTPARRLVPLCDAAVEWLLLCPERKDEVCVGMAIDRVRKAGIEAKMNLPENCFRHSYISHAVAASGDVARTSLDAGNSPTIIHKHYRSLVTKRQGEAWFAVRPGSTSGELLAMDGRAIV